jgi:hypothetical protein
MHHTFTIYRAAFAFFVLVGFSVSAQAYDEDDWRQVPSGLPSIAHRIAGGASLIDNLSRSSASDRFEELARRLDRALAQRRVRHLARDWREVRDAYEQTRRTVSAGDARIDFVLAHLQEDVAQGDRIVGSLPAPGPGPGTPPTTPGRVSFIDRQTCVGNARVGRSCPTSQSSLTFNIPREVAVIRRLEAEWRDYGSRANAEVYINDRLVWRTDVGEDWDSDNRPLDVRVTPGSTITVRSHDGAPIWIRKFTADTLREPERSFPYRDPWEFPWQDR